MTAAANATAATAATTTATAAAAAATAAAALAIETAANAVVGAGADGGAGALVAPYRAPQAQRHTPSATRSRLGGEGGHGAYDGACDGGGSSLGSGGGGIGGQGHTIIAGRRRPYPFGDLEDETNDDIAGGASAGRSACRPTFRGSTTLPNMGGALGARMHVPAFGATATHGPALGDSSISIGTGCGGSSGGIGGIGGNGGSGGSGSGGNCSASGFGAALAFGAAAGAELDGNGRHGPMMAMLQSLANPPAVAAASTATHSAGLAVGRAMAVMEEEEDAIEVEEAAMEVGEAAMEAEEAVESAAAEEASKAAVEDAMEEVAEDFVTVDVTAVVEAADEVMEKAVEAAAEEGEAAGEAAVVVEDKCDGGGSGGADSGGANSSGAGGVVVEVDYDEGDKGCAGDGRSGTGGDQNDEDDDDKKDGRAVRSSAAEMTAGEATLDSSLELGAALLATLYKGQGGA